MKFSDSNDGFLAVSDFGRKLVLNRKQPVQMPGEHRLKQISDQMFIAINQDVVRFGIATELNAEPVCSVPSAISNCYHEAGFPELN